MKPSLRVLLAAFLCSPSGWAVGWPSRDEGVAEKLQSADVTERKTAAAALPKLSRERARPLLTLCLADADETVRGLCADSAMVHEVHAEDVWIAWLSGREVSLRKKACEALLRLPSAKAAQPLSRAVGDSDPDVRTACIQALSRLPKEQATAPLLGRLDDPSPAVRVAVVRALGNMKDARSVVPLLGKSQDAAPEVRKAIARALGDLGDPRAVQALIATLRDAHPDVRREAIGALGLLRDEATVSAISPYAMDQNPAIRRAAIASLGKLATRRACEALTPLLASPQDTNKPVREALLQCLPTSRSLLESALGPPYPHKATAAAAWVLGTARSRESARAIVEAMRRGGLSEDAALFALGEMRADEGLPLALEFVENPKRPLRLAAEEALRKLLSTEAPDGRAVEPLAHAITHVEGLPPDERAALAELLGRTKAPRAATTLVSLTSDASPSVRSAALLGLGTLGPHGHDRVLLLGVQDQDAGVRLSAAIALGQGGGREAEHALVRGLLGDEPLHGETTLALHALGGIASRDPASLFFREGPRLLRTRTPEERDAWFAAMARSPRGLGFLEQALLERRQGERPILAGLFRTRPGSDATRVLRSLLGDRDPRVRREAAWAAWGHPGLRDRLLELLADADPDTSANAAASLGHAPPREDDRAVFCPLLVHKNPWTVANALAAIKQRTLECPNPARLEEAVHDGVRSAARASATPGGPPSFVEIYLSEVGHEPEPGARYALKFADGYVRLGTTDRRGALVEPNAPGGAVVLLPP